MLTFACIKVGTKYNADYPNALYAQVQKHLTIPHRFVCITDNPAGVRCECIPEDTNLSGWWTKLGLFREKPFGIEGRLVFCDLDNLIIGNLDELVSWDQDLIAVEDFTHKGQFNSAFFSIRTGSNTQVWDRFTGTHSMYGDQNWITKQVTYTRWPQSAVVSYKLEASRKISNEARVICFHGFPKPHQATGELGKLWRTAAKGL